MAMDEAERRAMLAQPALESPDGVEPNFADPPNMNALANGLVIAALIITLVAVLVRIHYWIFGLKQLRIRLEAVLVISGFGSYIGFVYCLLRIAQIEIGWWVHQWDVTVGDKAGFSYWAYIAGLLYNSAIAPVKVAILMEWMCIFSPQSRNVFFWFCHVVLWLNVVYYVASIIVESMQCTPRRLIWDPTVKGTCLGTKGAEIISSINVASDIILLVTPQFVIWRLESAMKKRLGMTLIFAVGLFGTISAIFRLVATQAFSKSKDSTYSAGPVYFWALGELASVFVVYALPAVPTAFISATTWFSRCYTRWTQGSSIGRTTNGPSASDINPWREARTRTSKRYRNLDRNSLPVNTLETATTLCTSTIIDPDPSTLPESVCVVKTIEIRRDEIRADKHGEIDKKEIGEDVLLRQHPWVKLG